MPLAVPTAACGIPCPRWPRFTLLWLLALGACSPTFNWRELRPQGTPLLALMPCKPEAAERTLPLDGIPTVMHMHSCEAGGQTFAVAWAEVGDESRVPAALAGWRAGALAALRVDATMAADARTQWPAAVPGAQVQQGAQAAGLGPDGQRTHMRGAYFSQGRQVFQAAVYGARLSDEALVTFFEGLKLS